MPDPVFKPSSQPLMKDLHLSPSRRTLNNYAVFFAKPSRKTLNKFGKPSRTLIILKNCIHTKNYMMECMQPVMNSIN